MVTSICITHAADADGLICAAYLRRVKDASVYLASYDKFEKTLKSVSRPIKEVFICDLGISKELCGEFLRINRFAQVTFIDHHPTDVEVLRKLKNSGVTVIHSLFDCASVLLFNCFEDKIGWNGARLAAYASISDQFENGPIASKLLARLDRQFVQHEALLLTHALSYKANSKFKMQVVEGLSNFSYPHEIKGVKEAALVYLEKTVELIETLPKNASKTGGVAYVEGAPGISLGSLASLLIDAMNVEVGVSYRKLNKGLMKISLRSRRGIHLNLGERTKLAARKHGGFGGGHRRASGAIIPANNFLDFIRNLQRELNKEKKKGF